MPRRGSGREFVCKNCRQPYKTSRTRRSVVFCSDDCNRAFKRTPEYREEQSDRISSYWASLSAEERENRVELLRQALTPELLARRDRSFYNFPKWRENQLEGARRAAKRRSREDRSRSGKLSWQRHPGPRTRTSQPHRTQDDRIVYVDSQWEAVVYDQLTAWDVGFSYVNEDKYHFRVDGRTWHPDFVLDDRRLIIEVKGFPAAVERFIDETVPAILNSRLLCRYAVAIADRAAVQAARKDRSFDDWLRSLAWFCTAAAPQYQPNVRRWWRG